MTCAQWRAAYLADESPPAEHVRVCAHCRAALHGLDQLRTILGETATWEEPDPATEGLMVGLIGAGAGHSVSSTSRRRLIGSVAAAMLAVALVAGAWLAFRPPAPDWEVALPGTEVAPAAGGTAKGWNVASGTRVVLDIEGLPPAPDGYVYELWFSAGPVHVSGGTFTTVAEADLTVGVSRADYPRVWVTLEAIDEDESLNGETVLDTKS